MEKRNFNSRSLSIAIILFLAFQLFLIWSLFSLALELREIRTKLNLILPSEEQVRKLELYLAVTKWSIYFNLDRDLVFALIKEESNFKRSALSQKGACSYMQVMWFHFDPEENPFDTDTNIREGCRVLRAALNRGGSIERALSIYNGSDPKDPFEESLIFSRRVLCSYERIKNGSFKPWVL